MKKTGLLISIDFELDWGYTNTNNPLSEREISKTLDDLMSVLETNQIKSTWAIVGQLFSNTDKDVVDNSKRRFNWIKETLINNKNIEIGSHTFNHIFCEEVSIEEFKNDLELIEDLDSNKKINFKSIVFPRNQYSDKNLELLNLKGYSHFRNVLPKWFLETNKFSDESLITKLMKRSCELLPFNRDVIVREEGNMTSISDSRFFRFFPDSILGNLLSRYYYALLRFELRRCLRRGNMFHIWFHPHNLMKKPKAIKRLTEFITYYKQIESKNQECNSYTFTEISSL